MRRIAAVAVLALALLTGTARGDTFAIVPPSGVQQPALIALPSAALPNLPGKIVVPASLTTPPTAPAQLSYAQLQGLWQRAGAAYGVPWRVLAAINKVESNLGRNMGPSSAGAIGWMQFMPSTWLRWGVDANGDGVADPWNPEDAVFSAARYLAAAGGARDIASAVYSYNHASWYVQEVLDLAQLYGQGGAIAFNLDQVQLRLDRARQHVVQVNRRLVAKLALVRRLTLAERLWQKRERSALLLSDRLEAGKHAGRIEARRQPAQEKALWLRARLETARRALASIRTDAKPVSFTAGANELLAAPIFSGGYAFPVGGGPGSVSVAHVHHDYPAADIAAPAGAPVYALADAVVLRAWTYPDPTCGIGLTFRTGDGQVWTYCHLAYEEPGILPGMQLVAGETVGLVGSTGDATGPHLHLQLQPPTAYPQDEQWFQSLAGVAFRWQDIPAAEGTLPSTVQFAPARSLAAVQASAAPVFQIVQQQASAPSPDVVFFTR